MIYFEWESLVLCFVENRRRIMKFDHKNGDIHKHMVINEKQNIRASVYRKWMVLGENKYYQ